MEQEGRGGRAPAAGELEVDHSHIRHALEKLGGTEDDGALAALLDDFIAYLTRHFANEERPGGFFAQVVETSPRHQYTVRELRDDHTRILAALRSAREDIREPYGKAPPARLSRIGMLLAMVRSHERREHGLLQDALARDIGESE
jgi:hypothetical protein